MFSSRRRADAWTLTTLSLCKLFTCRNRCALCVNFLGHSLHENGRSPRCDRSCTDKVSFRANADPHVAHVKGFSSVWVRRCFCKVLVDPKNRSQCSQAKGRTPVCIREWTCSWNVSRIFAPQISHSSGLSRVKPSFPCKNICRRRLLINICWSQTLQRVRPSSPPWYCIWQRRWAEVRKVLEHTLHL